MTDTTPNKLADLSTESLEACYHYFSEAHREAELPQMVKAAADRMPELRSEMELRRMEEHSQRQHGEAIGQGRKILFWARWAVAAAVVVPMLVALIADIPFSKLLRATSFRSAPKSLPQTAPTASPMRLPRATESPSATPQASPTTSEATATPE